MIVRASWSLFQQDGAAAFKWSERSPLPPAVSAKDLPGGRTQILNVHEIRRINYHPVNSDGDSAPETISDTENWLIWDADLGNPNDYNDDCAVDVESHIGQDQGIEDLECPQQWDVSAVPNVAGLIQPTRKSKRLAEKMFVMVNAIETTRNKVVKKK